MWWHCNSLVHDSFHLQTSPLTSWHKNTLEKENTKSEGLLTASQQDIFQYFYQYTRLTINTDDFLDHIVPEPFQRPCWGETWSAPRLLNDRPIQNEFDTTVPWLYIKELRSRLWHDVIRLYFAWRLGDCMTSRSPFADRIAEILSWADSCKLSSLDESVRSWLWNWSVFLKILVKL